MDDTTTDDSQVAVQIRLRRVRCKIPDDVRHREKWRLALDMLDEILTPDAGTDTEVGGWGLPRLPVVADAGYGDATGFRLGLAERGLSYVVAVKPTTSAYPAEAEPELLPYTPGRGRRPVPRYREAPTDLQTLVLAAGRADR
jgi:hypothetical protein